MFLKSNLPFIYDHKLLLILPGDNEITPELKSKLEKDESIKEHLSHGKLVFTEVLEKKVELKPMSFGSAIPKLPEYEPEKEEPF